MMDAKTATTFSMAALAVISFIYYACMTYGTFFAKKKPPSDGQEPDEEL